MTGLLDNLGGYPGGGVNEAGPAATPTLELRQHRAQNEFRLSITEPRRHR